MNIEGVGKLFSHKIVPDGMLNKETGLKSLTDIDAAASLGPRFG